MLNKKNKQRYAAVNTMSRRLPGATSSSTETNAAKTEEMNPQTSLAESVEEVNCNIHLEEESREEEMGEGKEASSLPEHVLGCHSDDDESEQVGTDGTFPQLCLAADGETMIPDEASLFLVNTETTRKKDKIANTPVVVESHESKNITRNKGMQSAGHWSANDKLTLGPSVYLEKDRLYLALKVFGSNFYAMEKVFETRNRQELKNQFKELVKKNPRLIEESKSDKKSLIELRQAVRESKGMAPYSTPTKSSTPAKSTPAKSTPTKRGKGKKQLTGSKKVKGTATMSPLTMALALPPSIASPSDTTRAVRKITPRISNIVASVKLGRKIDIRKIVRTTFNAEWDPKQPSRVALRLSTSTANIFQTGKVMCFGARSIQQALLDMRKYACLVQRCVNAEVKFANFEIKTITASATVPYYIKLDALALKHSSCCRHDPEVTAGLKFKMQDPKVTFNIFTSGSIVLTGGKSQDEVNRAFEEILKIVQEFKKQ